MRSPAGVSKRIIGCRIIAGGSGSDPLENRQATRDLLAECAGKLPIRQEARMQLDDELIPVRPGMAIVVRPGCRHRAVGRMTVLIVCTPKFDPHDEWMD